ncbi:MAG: 50S ribosomal protein L4 [Candidatus Thermoplasmatota archaeon]
MTKVNVYGIDGKSKEKIDLPKIFDTPVRTDLIQKSFKVLRANKRQPYGSDPRAGAKHATASVGKGRGMSRVPRLTQGRAAALAPCVVGGRRAHPPKSVKNWKEKINKKEKKLALKSAIAATSKKELVSQRGHKFNEEISLPIVIDDKFENTKKTKKALDTFKKMNIYEDIERAREGKHIRSGKGKGRGRKYKTPKSILLVTTKEKTRKCVRNLPGVDVVLPDQINIENLAPGGNPGRLTVFTKSAIKKIGGAN